MKKLLLILSFASLFAVIPTAVYGGSVQVPYIRNLQATANPRIADNQDWANAHQQYLQGLQQFLQQQQQQTPPTAPQVPVALPAAASVSFTYTLSNTNLTDVAGHPLENVILYTADRGYTRVFPDNTFRPDTNITRGDFAHFLGNFASNNMGLLSRLGYTTSRRNVNFNDVNPDHFFHDQVMELARRNVIHENNNTNFRPNDNITREEMSRMVFNLIRALRDFDSEFTNNEAEDVLDRFNDGNQVASANRVAAAYLAQRGFFLPSPNLNPRGNVTRAEAAAIITYLGLYLNGGPNMGTGALGLTRVQARNITPAGFDLEFTVNGAAMWRGAALTFGFTPTQQVITAANIANPQVLPNTRTVIINSLNLVSSFPHQHVYSINVSGELPGTYWIYAMLRHNAETTPVRVTTVSATLGPTPPNTQNMPPVQFTPFWNIGTDNSLFWAGNWNMPPNWNMLPNWNMPPNWENFPNQNMPPNWENLPNNFPPGTWGAWGTEISFGDELIEEEVRRLLSRHTGPIFPQDVARIRELDILIPATYRVNRRALSGLEHFTGLRYFSFTYRDPSASNNSNLADFRELEELRNLRELNLNGHQISNIRALRNMRDLEFLSLSHNEISDINDMRNLRSLVRVNLSYNDITDFSVLWDTLDLRDNQVDIRGNP